MPSPLRFDVATPELLHRLASGPLPLGLRGTRSVPSGHRDIYFDTPDGTLERREATCRLRLHSDGRCTLSLLVGGDAGGTDRSDDGEVVGKGGDGIDPRRVLTGASRPARRLRALVDPRHLVPVVELEVEREVRRVLHRWLPVPWLEMRFEVSTVRSGGAARTFQEVSVHPLHRGRLVGDPELDALARALRDTHGLQPVVAEPRERAQLLLKWMRPEGEDLAPVSWALALVATGGGRIACIMDGGIPHLPMTEGCGEAAARALLACWFGGVPAELRRLGAISSVRPVPALEVWGAELHRRPEVRGLTWQSLPDALQRLTGSDPGDADTLAALTLAARAGGGGSAGVIARGGSAGGLRATGSGSVTGPSASRPAVDTDAGLPASREWPARTQGGAVGEGPSAFLNAELSLLDFTARVLAFAEDPRTPLLERLRYVVITGSNLDEFVMVQVAGLKAAVAAGIHERGDDGLSPSERLEALSLRIPALVVRQHRCWRSCTAELATHGTRLLTWAELGEHAQEHLRSRFRDEMLPALTPLAMTLSPGHPFPFLRHLRLALAVVLREPQGRPARFVEVELPDELPRTVPVPGGSDVVLIEEVVRGNLDLLHPGAQVEHAYWFRVTRGGDLELDEAQATSLLAAVEAAVWRRATSPVVRVEVERGMPMVLREMLLGELRREHGHGALADADLQEIDAPLDLAGLGVLAALPLPHLQWSPFRPRDPLAGDRSVLERIGAGDVLLHHPYDDWDATTGRLFREAADDPDVTAIKVTLYRAGDRSPVVDALVRAARAGKEVVVFVELKARFDEARNVEWATTLERSGVRVVHGIVGFKNHAKMALVVRREGDRARRYVHVATGNFNAVTARRYSDLSLLSAREDLAADVGDLFNELTGMSRPPERALRRCLVAPGQLLPGILARIRREAEHARTGRDARIRIKVNGLSDAEVVHALCEASRAGVEIDLLVRGICVLRPGVRGISERIRVRGTVGRFLEHGRIYHFANGGAPEYFIGSADLRTRNLRRRIELLVPVDDPACRARLDRLLDLELADPTTWRLTPHGEWVRGEGAGEPSMQEQLLAEADPPEF